MTNMRYAATVDDKDITVKLEGGLVVRLFIVIFKSQQVGASDLMKIINHHYKL